MDIHHTFLVLTLHDMTLATRLFESPRHGFLAIRVSHYSSLASLASFHAIGLTIPMLWLVVSGVTLHDMALATLEVSMLQLSHDTSLSIVTSPASSDLSVVTQRLSI